MNRLGATLALEAMALYLRRSPVDRGRWRLLNAAVPLSRSVLREARYRTVRTRHGFRMRVNQGDWLGRHVFVTGDYEPPTARLIGALLGPGDLFVDVGANAGFFTLLGSRRVGPTGRVVAFEPLPRTRLDLLENLRLNGAGNVEVRDEAASDAPGELAFYVGPDDHRGTSSLRPIDRAAERIRVRAVRLDDVLPTDRRVSLVKLDVEGAEGLALAEMRRRLASDSPDLIVEVTDSYLRPMGDSASGLCDRLMKMSYRMYAILDDGPEPADPGRAGLPAQFNALFTKRPALPGQFAAGGPR